MHRVNNQSREIGGIKFNCIEIILDCEINNINYIYFFFTKSKIFYRKEVKE